ncbi:Signal transduction histidine kinase [Gemmobacter megaterium]|uniref:histidine kinase n=1 Tax=Gemmobacter megaterium TaxID=1086013 RepID=A0A1N7MJ99_9RHOB|nr:PAS-domain containing protein [Gemmobacter megaterium]GGE06509.1 signal transduction histidine kinase [Gemmobacter megaterium]SIS86100.1 Signal transduction histidine kinase [Gemmobacter megaterium]
MPAAEETHAGLIRAGLNLIQQGLSIFDSDLRLAVCNRRFQSMFDFPDELVTPGAAFEDVIRFQVGRGEYGPVDDADAAVRMRVEAARAFVPHYMERQRANGRWISVEGAPLPQGGWVTVYTDITEVKLQEGLLRARSEELSDEVLANAERLAQTNRQLAASNAALEEAKRELTEMEARTRLTTEMMPAHIAHVGRDLRYTYSNRRLNSVLPGRPSNILGLTGREALGPSTFAKIEQNLRQALAGEATVLEFSDDDSGRRIRGAFTPDRVGDGPISGVYILSMDVTEEVQARAALTQTRKRELAAQLTSGLAHDFANLLTIILGLQSRLAKLELPAEAPDLVQGTLAAARRGGVLLDRIGSISGKRALKPVAVDLTAFGTELRTLARAALSDRMTLEIRIDDFGGPVLLDPGAMQDALLNLILNARDAIGSAGGRITVTIRPVRDTWAEFTVADDGPGFTPEALERGLDPFFTTKGGEGSGLGLAMVFDHANLAGGSVRLANRVPRGGLVTLRLPLRRVAAPGPPGLVLLVEDSDDIRQSVREMLRSFGHAVIEATSAEEALSLAALPGLRLILSDINLKGAATGVDLAEHLTNDEVDVPVMLMTSLPATDPRRRRAEHRFPVLAKPFDAVTLSAFLSGVPQKEPAA